MKLYRAFAGLALAAVAAAAVPVSAANVTADPQAIATVLKAQGAEATIGKDTKGDPKIDASFGENELFTVYFYGCTNNANCDNVQLYAGYTESSVDGSKLIEWNRTRRYGRAYIDETGDPAVEMDVSLREGGMSTELFVDNLETWHEVMNAFSDFIYE